jgi:hypothetical protein
MRLLMLPFFILRLLGSLTPFFIELLWLLAQPYLGMVLFLSLVAVYVVSFMKAATVTKEIDTQPSVATEIERTTLQKRTDQLQNRFMENAHLVVYQDDESLFPIIEKLRHGYVQSPYHRDILLNLAVIASEKNETENAQKYLQELEYSDPNNRLVKD